MGTKHLPILLAAAVLCQGASGQSRETEDWWADYVAAQQDMFELFNACEGMAYHVSVSGEGSHDSAPRDSEIENAIESRLRAARIFEEDPQGAAKSYFNVYVILVGTAASLHIGFQKPGFVDPYSKHRMAQFPRGMETWRKDWLVQGGYRSGDLLAQLSKYLDEFIASYLRVNSEESCENYRVAERERKARLEAERAANRAERDARAARWKGWSKEQCESLPSDVEECLNYVDFEEYLNEHAT